MNITISDFFLGVIAVAMAIIAIKITFSFNLNEWLKERDEKLKSKIKNYCPHARFGKFGEQIGLQSTFVSPSGTLNWICQQCGVQLLHLDREAEDERMQYFLKNPKEFAKQEKKFRKLLKKAGML